MGLFGWIEDAVGDVASTVTGAVSDVGSGIADAVSGVAEAMGDAASEAMAVIAPVAASFGKIGSKVASNIAGSVVGLIDEDLGNDVRGGLREGWDGLIDSIAGSAQELTDWAAEGLGSSVAGEHRDARQLQAAMLGAIQQSGILEGGGAPKEGPASTASRMARGELATSVQSGGGGGMSMMTMAAIAVAAFFGWKYRRKLGLA